MLEKAEGEVRGTDQMFAVFSNFSKLVLAEKDTPMGKIHLYYLFPPAVYYSYSLKRKQNKTKIQQHLLKFKRLLKAQIHHPG